MRRKVYKKKFPDKQRRRQVTIDDARYEKLVEVGEGNFSEGVRIACDKFKVKK